MEEHTWAANAAAAQWMVRLLWKEISRHRYQHCCPYGNVGDLEPFTSLFYPGWWTPSIPAQILPVFGSTVSHRASLKQTDSASGEIKV